MDTETAVQDSLRLLRRMSENPDVVLEALVPAERSALMGKLRALADRCAEVEDKEALRHATDAVHRLVGETPALGALLLPRETSVTLPRERPTTRKISFEYDQKAYRKSRYAQDRGAQIRNHVVVCRQKLESALQEYSEDRR